MPLSSPLRGIVTPLLTPLDRPDRLDADGLYRLIEHVIAGGVSGIFVLGTSGEGPSLSRQMQEEVIRRTCGSVNGRVPVLVGIADSSLEESLSLARFAADSGAGAVVTTGPLYMPVAQDQLIDYVRDLSERSPLPVYLYNIPSHSHVSFAVETVRRSAELPNIAGLKDSAGQIIYLHQLRQALADRPDFTLLVGPEEMMAECVMLGIHGGVNGGSNLFPGLYVRLYEAAARGDLALVRELQPRVIEISKRIYSAVPYGSGYLQGVKCAASLLGLCAGELAPPYKALAGSQLEYMKRQVDVVAGLID
jgi:4-hydroxy-tetrahydrodipicolinate synthase